MHKLVAFLVATLAVLSSQKAATAEDITLSLQETFCTLIYLDRYLGIERFVIRYDPSVCPPPTEFASLRSASARAITFEAMTCFAENLQEMVLESDAVMDFVLSHCNLPMKPILLGEITFAESLQMAPPSCHQSLTTEVIDPAITLMPQSGTSLTVSTECRP